MLASCHGPQPRVSALSPRCHDSLQTAAPDVTNSRDYMTSRPQLPPHRVHIFVFVAFLFVTPDNQISFTIALGQASSSEEIILKQEHSIILEISLSCNIL